MVAVSELGQFVEKYPKYRLTAFLPHMVGTPFNFTGKDFVYRPSRQCPENVLYLVYDPAQQHYGATKSPGEILRKIKNTTAIVWCHKCIGHYNNTQEHVCVDGEPGPRKKTKVWVKEACDKCGISGIHTCEKNSCQFCKGIHDLADGFNHRCIVYKEPRSEKKSKFVTTLEEVDGPLTALWVYDFESRIKIEESVRNLVTEFRMDGNNYAEDGEDVRVYDFKVQKHVVNFAACKNVFTNETREFFGEDALQDFLLFLLSYNKGNNICIAHNASGYDTRLLFDKAKDLQDAVAIDPIMRGGKFMQLKINK